MIARLFHPVDARSLAIFRIVFGSLMVIATLRYYAYGWIAPMYQEPQFFFPYPGFEWVRPWPGNGMYIHYAFITLGALGIALGLAYRWSAALFFASFTYAQLIDKSTYLNHYYLVSLLALLLIFLPTAGRWSVDAWLRPATRRDTVPLWTVALLRFQLGVVYFFAGVAKLNADWLWSAQPLRIWLAPLADLAWVGPLFVLPWVPYVASWLAAAFDLCIPFLLLSPRSRRLAYAAVVVFHVGTALLFPIGLFPWLMIGLTAIFFPPDWPACLAGRWSTSSPVASTAPLAATRHRRLVLASLALYAFVQIAVPLRSWRAPGDVNWTEDGFRFAWRVMLIEKHGRTRFTLVDASTGAATEVDPDEYLTPLQTRMMSTQPDMILQFAHWLADQERSRGRDVEVHAKADVSLNGRPHQMLIDPQADLASLTTDAPRGAWVQRLRGDS